MSLVPVDLTAGRAAIERLSGTVAAMLESNPASTGRPVPLLAWNVGETAAHLVTLIRALSGYFSAELRPPGATSQIPQINQQRIEALPDRHGGDLAKLLLDATGDFVSATAEGSAAQPFPWYDDQPIDLGAATSILVGEMSIHGGDIARGLALPWRIDPDDARLMLPGMWELLPRYVDPTTTSDVIVAYQMRIRGAPRVRVDIDRGGATVGPMREPIDCRISADPAAFVEVCYRRRSLLSAALSGRIVAWGLKSWMGLRLLGFLRPP